MRRTALALAFTLSLAGAAAAQVSTDPAAAPAGAYDMETRHSQVLFDIGHFGLTGFHGRFDKLSGTLTYDGAHPEKSAVSVSIDMASVDTPFEELNGELSSEHVFDAAKYPAATFKSTSITVTGPGKGKITGNLTLHGVTRRVVLDTVFNGTRPHPMNKTASLGFSATTTIKRSDFGLTSMGWAAFVGDDVTLTIEAMFVKKG